MITMITMMIIRPILALVLVYATGLGIYGAWIAVAADQLTRTILVFARYKQGKWKQIRVSSTDCINQRKRGAA